MELFSWAASSPRPAVVPASSALLCVRYTRIFFGILTMALSQVLWSLAFKFFWVTGGTDGLRVPTPTLLGGFVAGRRRQVRVPLATGTTSTSSRSSSIAVAVMWVIVHSPFGKALQAIRDNETRAEFVGVQVRRYRWVAFLVSGIFTGLAGALWVPLNGLTTPDILHWTFSGKIVFFTVLGGFQTFSGPIIGAIVFNYLETYAVGHTVYWQMVLGIVLVVLVLALPAGIVGTAAAPARCAGGRREREPARDHASSASPSGRPTRWTTWTSACTEGEVLALIGSNGAGKTTLVNLISGLIPPDSGRIEFQGADITRGLRAPARSRAGIARSFQLVNLFDQLSVLDNVALAIFSREGKTRRLFSLADADTAVRDEAVEVLKQFGLDTQAPGRPRAACPRASASSSTWRSPTRSSPSSSSSTSRPAG